ncbi:MAG: flagellar assembly peptidoglycan hydrolase FlgJ [Gallionellaceae bacterium]|jgi:flagellar protein FlgJ
MAAQINNNMAAIDTKDLDVLRAQAKQAPDKALQKAAKQFEEVFMNMMLKSMRDATPQDGLFDSEQTKMFTSMLDQQLSQSIGGTHGIGLADMMVKQLSRQIHGTEHLASVNNEKPVATTLLAARAGNALPSAYSENTQQAFVQRMLPHAMAVSRESGLPAHQMIGQAALESGWGRREILNADGSSSHNLFGIKAGADWKGKVVEAKTTEYHNGVVSKPTEKFRAYDSYADSFRDYAKLLSENPRYAKVLEQSASVQGFAQALQNAGYATDPKYADKLVQVIGRVKTLT